MAIQVALMIPTVAQKSLLLGPTDAAQAAVAELEQLPRGAEGWL
jgi:hypothetical protein